MQYLALTVLGVAIFIALSVAAHRKRQRAASRRGEPSPAYLEVTREGILGTIGITMVCVSAVVLAVWLQRRTPAEEFYMGLGLAVILIGGLVYLIFFEKKPSLTRHTSSRVPRPALADRDAAG